MHVPELGGSRRPARFAHAKLSRFVHIYVYIHTYTNTYIYICKYMCKFSIAFAPGACMYTRVPFVVYTVGKLRGGRPGVRVNPLTPVPPSRGAG